MTVWIAICELGTRDIQLFYSQSAAKKYIRNQDNPTRYYIETRVVREC